MSKETKVSFDQITTEVEDYRGEFVSRVIEKADELGMPCFIVTDESVSGCTSNTDADVASMSSLFDLRKVIAFDDEFDVCRFFDIFVEFYCSHIYVNLENLNQLHILNADYYDDGFTTYAVRVEGDITTDNNSGVIPRYYIQKPFIYLYRIDSVTLIPHPLLLMMPMFIGKNTDIGIFRIFKLDDSCHIVPTEYVDVNMSDRIDDGDWYKKFMSEHDADELIEVLNHAML